ncbi:hypothetical protein ES702_07307 [subsurface metagenome]
MNFLTKFNQLSGKMRLAVLISVVWFVLCFFGSLMEREPAQGILLGVLPLLVAWGGWWVRLGFKKDKGE